MSRFRSVVALSVAAGLALVLSGAEVGVLGQTPGGAPGRAQMFEFTVDGATPAAAKLEAYATAVAKGAGVALIGSDVYAHFDDAKRMVVEDRRGVVSMLEYQPLDAAGRRLSVKAYWTPDGDIRRESRALRVLIDAMGNPGVMVLSLEANMGRQVFRAASDTLVKQMLLKAGFTVQAAPQSYLDRIEELKKSVEFRRAAGMEVTVNPALGSSVVNRVEQEYMVKWRDLVLGQGDDAQTFRAARSVGASFVVVGDCYTQEVPLPVAAKAYADQGYKQARAYLNLQAMSTETKTMLAAAMTDATQMDFSLDASGNKAITAAVQKAEAFVFDMAAQLRSKDLAVSVK